MVHYNNIIGTMGHYNNIIGTMGHYNNIIGTMGHYNNIYIYAYLVMRDICLVPHHGICIRWPDINA